MHVHRILKDEEFLQALQDMLTLAQKSIYISTFKAEITTKPRGRALHKFFEGVFEKSRLGLDVRVLINRTTPRGSIPLSNLYAIGELQKHGVKVRCLKDNRVCHAKVMIVDKMAAVFGSHNLSVKSCHNNFEISYVANAPMVVNYLAGIFEGVWETAQKP